MPDEIAPNNSAGPSNSSPAVDIHRQTFFKRLVNAVQDLNHFFLCVGTADSHYVPDKLVEVHEATAGQAMVIENVDDSREIEGDIIESIRVLERIMGEIQKFLDESW